MPAHILVIEDNRASLELMTYLLTVFGYRVSSAEDGGEGLYAIRNNSPDLVICDVQLPTVSGYEVAHLAKHYPAAKNIPLIAVTALAMVGDRDKILSAGFDGYIAKPIEAEFFVAEVERFLRTDQLSQANSRFYRAPSAAPKDQPASRQATILLLDDAALNITLIKSILEPFGCRVETAKSPDEAIGVCRNTELDLIMTDIRLLAANGYDLPDYLKRSRPLQPVPVFVLSASADAKERERAIRGGAVKVFSGPIEPAVLVAEVAAVLNKSGGSKDGNRAGG